jgi:murein tripeptide amidase MpaA
MSYLNVDEIESALENLAAAYPAASALITVPNSTHEGRRSHVLRIGAASSECDAVLLLGGVHAREWVPPDALVALAADLLEAFDQGTGLRYGGKSFTAHDIHRLVATMNIYVYPCVNPDGRSYSQTAEPLWRKNRRRNEGGCAGVDINRNFDFLWDHLAKFAPDSDVKTSDDPCDPDVYRGPSPASEPETRNVVWLLDNDPGIRWHVDVHSAVPVVLHSWGSDQNQSTDTAQNFRNAGFDGVRGRADDAGYREYICAEDLAIATALSAELDDGIAAVRGDRYGAEPAFGLYPTSGASDDYAFSRCFVDPAKTKVFGFTIECGHTFQPAWSEAENVIREVSAGLIAFCLAAARHSGGVNADEHVVAGRPG